jgi:3-hydroxyisobutyrate dehydrogenase-like beta-hydroxyacid dehydrogenase
MSIRARKNVGVIGLGIIGHRVAENLRERGFRVFVWNRTPRPVPNFVGSPSEVVELCHAIQIFVSDDEALLEMIQRISRDLGPDHLVMAHCTVSPDTMRAAAEIVARRGARFLDAPFTGSKSAAEKAQLVYYVGGEEAALQQARPILEASSKEIIEIGQVGDATTIKVATNMVTAATVQGAAEALALISKSHLPAEIFARAMRSNGSYSGTLDMKLPMMIDGDYEAHFSVKHMLKDVAIASRLARIFGIEVGATDASRRALQGEMQEGRGGDDYSSLFRQYFPKGISPKQADQAANEDETQPSFEGIDEQITVEIKPDEPEESAPPEVAEKALADRPAVSEVAEKPHENGSAPAETTASSETKESPPPARSIAPAEETVIASPARSTTPETREATTSIARSSAPNKEAKSSSPASTPTPDPDDRAESPEPSTAAEKNVATSTEATKDAESEEPVGMWANFWRRQSED